MDLKTLKKSKVPVNSAHVHFDINGMVYVKKFDKRITNISISTGRPEKRPGGEPTDRPGGEPEDRPGGEPEDTLKDLLSPSNGDLPKDPLSDHHDNSTTNGSSTTAYSTSEQTEQTGAILVLYSAVFLFVFFHIQFMINDG